VGHNDSIEVRGFKYLLDVFPLLQRLHDSGCARDVAGNRNLFFDQYAALMLVAMFSPAVDSMRSICRASALKKVQKKLGIKRISLGSFSESSHIFDPDLLLGIIEQLAGRLNPVGADPRLKDVKHLLTVVDATLLKALPKLVQAAWADNCDGSKRFAWKLHTQFEIDKHVPMRIDITRPLNGGKSDEAAVLRKNLQPGRCYIMDRYFAQFALFNEIHAIGSSYVCRIRDNFTFEVIEERELSREALDAGVVRDAVVKLGTASKQHKRPNHSVRLVEVACTPHEKRGGRKGKTAGPPSAETLLIATDLLDLPAELIALIYRYRWTIEIFFRFFKHLLGCRHLYSQHPNGVAIQVYCAIICCLLLNLWTNSKPTKATLEMFAWYFSGWADEQELESHLRKLQKTPV
jgi:Transposase DDE domain